MPTLGTQMRILQQVKIAIVLGTFAELILVAPLFLVFHSQIAEMVPLPTWVVALEELHWPGLPLIESLYRTHWMSQLAAQFPHSNWVIHAKGWLVIFVQATTFALVAFVVMYIYGLLKTRVPPGRSLRLRRMER
jgi:hypothetical protein